MQKIKELQAQQVDYPPELDIPIPDPEMIGKASDPTWQAEEERKAKGKGTNLGSVRKTKKGKKRKKTQSLF